MNTKIKYFCSLVIFLSSLLSAAILIENILPKINLNAAKASSADVQFPIPELGNCENKDSCKSYCDKPENVEACLSFAEKNNLMDKKEIEMAKKFTEIGKGPGGCTTKDSCDQYCSDANNISECVSFAEKNGLMSPEELEEAKKVKSAIEKGIKPPACGGKKQCDDYCESSDHMEECITFAEAAGFLSPQEIKESKQVLAAIKKGIKPPACRGKEECDDYCGEDSHFNECITFAEAAGLMSAQEAEMAKKTGGKGPGGCKSNEECDAFCQNENNIETCTAFAIEHGLVSEKDAEMMRKTGGKGPGGCKSKESCEAFCNDPKNEEACFNFGKEHGLISPEDLQKMEQGKEEMKKALEQAPPEVINCLTSSIGQDAIEKIKNGTVMPSRGIGENMEKCFKQQAPIEQPIGPNNSGNMQLPDGQMQPGQFQNNGGEQRYQPQPNNMPPQQNNGRLQIQPIFLNGSNGKPSTQNGQTPFMPQQGMTPGESNGGPVFDPMNPNPQQFMREGMEILPMNPSNPLNTGSQQPNTNPPANIQPQQSPAGMTQPQEINQPSPPPPSSSNNPESLIGMVVNFFLKLIK